MLGDVSVRRWRLAAATCAAGFAAAAATAPPVAAAPQTLSPLPILATLPSAATPHNAGCSLGARSRSGFSQELGAIATADIIDLLLEAWPSVTVCDGSRVGTARPADGITGQLVDDRGLLETAGPGLRSLSSRIYKLNEDLEPVGFLRGRGLIAGDRVEIPATQAPGGARVWVQAGMGSQSIDVPAGPAATVLVQAEEVNITQGTSSRAVPVVPVAEQLLSVELRRTEQRLRVVVQGAPNGSTVAITAGAFTRKVRVRRGAAATSFRSSRGRTEVSAVLPDTTTRVLSLTECMSPAPGRTRRCAGKPLVRSSAGVRAVRRLAAVDAPDQQTHVRRQATRPSAPRARAASARPTFRMKAIKVARDTQTPVGDANGDGHADFVDASTDDGGGAFAELLLSTPTGTAPTGVQVLADEITPVGDLDGDGFSDLLLDHDRIAFGTGAVRDLTAASTLGSPGALRLRPRLGSIESLFDIALFDALLTDRLTSARVLQDTTGDGRPELATAADRGGLIVGSGQLTRGQSISLPTNTGTAFLRVTTTTSTGVATVQPIRNATSRRTGQAQIAQVDSTAAIRRGPILEARGNPVRLDAAPSGGGFALTWSSRDDTTTVMRLDAQGAMLSAVKFRDLTDVQFGPDGPDADDLPELYLKNDETVPVLVLQSAMRGRVSRARLPAVVVTDGPKITLNRGAQIASVSGSASLTAQVIRLKSFTAPWYRLTPLP